MGPNTEFHFPKTRWSIVIAAASPSDRAAAAALQELCRLYWPPLYGYARRWGLSPEDAEDRTQEFLARATQGAYFQGPTQEQGRLRNFLLTAFKRDLIDATRSEQRQKRGGKLTFLSLETQGLENELHQCTDSVTPDDCFERLWALTVIEKTISRLSQEYETGGRSLLFEVLRPFLDPSAEMGHAEAAAKLNVTEGALRQAIFRIRQRFRQIIRDEVANTLTAPDDELVSEELRVIQKALSM